MRLMLSECHGKVGSKVLTDGIAIPTTFAFSLLLFRLPDVGSSKSLVTPLQHEFFLVIALGVPRSRCIWLLFTQGNDDLAADWFLEI